MTGGETAVLKWTFSCLSIAPERRVHVRDWQRKQPMRSQHHHREALLKSHHGALAHQQMADASWRIGTRGRAGEARASGLDARTFTHRRRKSGTEGGRLKINSDEFIHKLINTTIKNEETNLKRLGLPVEVVRKVTGTPAVCRRGKNV